MNAYVLQQNKTLFQLACINKLFAFGFQVICLWGNEISHMVLYACYNVCIPNAMKLIYIKLIWIAFEIYSIPVMPEGKYSLFKM